mmetsp:Transcript_8210/g.24271  ORF Transcript_8210/g.24271 Transcript_8210/m.24271 type:complete len:212 (-) Transcript_8210:794-1429(-)
MRFVENSFRPGDHVVLVVIKHENPHVGVVFGQLWSEVVPHKVSLRLRRVATGLPGRGEFRLVLDRDGLQRYSSLAVGRHEFRKVQCPGLGIFGIRARPLAQAAGHGAPGHSRGVDPTRRDVVFGMWALHPARWGPRRGKDLEIAIRDCSEIVFLGGGARLVVVVFAVLPGRFKGRSCPQEHVDHPVLLGIVRHVGVKMLQFEIPVHLIKAV